MSNSEESYIWVFMGAGGWTPAGVFSTRDKAREWITNNRLTGYLGKFPIDISVFDWAVQEGHYTPESERDQDSIAKQRFGTSVLAHEHYYDGHLGHNTKVDTGEG